MVTHKQIILQLKLIMITHIHADHHLGMVRIILRRMEIIEERRKKGLEIPPPILVIAPHSVGHWLNELSEILPLSFRFFSCFDILSSPSPLLFLFSLFLFLFYNAYLHFYYIYCNYFYYYYYYLLFE